MNQTRAFSVLSLALVAMCGCASQSNPRLAKNNDPAGIDVEYMRNVERRAAIAGVDVKWVNVPSKQKARTDE